VSREIDRRLAASNKGGVEDKTKTAETETKRVYKVPGKEEREENFLEAWMRKKSELEKDMKPAEQPQEDGFWRADDRISIRS